MTFSELRNLEWSNIGSWPGLIKALVILILCVAVLGAGWYFDTQHMIGDLDKAKDNEVTLRSTFEAKQKMAANLEPLKQQLAEMKQSFGAMLRLLPNKTEIEGLLVDISQSGLAAGLEFELFKPQAELPKEFYAIQPISITVTGDYHEVGEFISAVAALPRIVTQHDVSIKPLQVAGEDLPPAGSETPLRMTMVARTYRYLDEEEIAAVAAEAAEKKGKRKKRR